MHPNAAFRVRDEPSLLAHLARYPFTTIAAAVEGRILMAHAPVVVRRLAGQLALDFHLSRTNAFAGLIGNGFQAVFVSLAADAYVSPDWYEAPGDQVPIWNYVSVEAEGQVAQLADGDLVRLLDDLTAQEEARLPPKPPWTRGKMGPGRFEAMTRGVVGGRLTVSRLEGTRKLSQNKTAADRAGVIDALGAHQIATLMRSLP